MDYTIEPVVYDRTRRSELYSGKNVTMHPRKDSVENHEDEVEADAIPRGRVCSQAYHTQVMPCSCIMIAGKGLNSSSWPLLQMFHEAVGAKVVKSRSAHKTQQKGVLAVT